MALGGVGADSKNAVSGTHVVEFADRVCHRPVTKSGGQTGHSWSVSETRAVVDIVGADSCAHKFLHEEIFFVGAAGRAESRDAVRTEVFLYGSKTLGNDGIGFFPACLDKLSVFANKRSLEAALVVDEVISKMAFATQRTIVDRILLVWLHASDGAVFDQQIKRAA